MSTVLATITAAYRRCGILASRQVLQAAQKDVGLERLQAWVQTWGAGLFGTFTEKMLTSADDYEAAEFERVLNPDGATVTLPSTIVDDHSGEDRSPKDGALIQIVNSAEALDEDIFEMYVYDATRGDWLSLTNLDVDDYMPMSNVYDDHLKNILGVFIADDVGGRITPLLAQRAGLGKLALATQGASKRRPVPGAYY